MGQKNEMALIGGIGQKVQILRRGLARRALLCGRARDEDHGLGDFVGKQLDRAAVLKRRHRDNDIGLMRRQPLFGRGQARRRRDLIGTG
jgi:hypothetical protein